MPHHQFRDAAHKALFLSNLDKDIGSDGKLILIGPAHQGLRFHNLTARQLHNRLVDHLQRVSPDRPLQLVLDSLFADMKERAEKSKQSARDPAQYNKCC